MDWNHFDDGGNAVMVDVTEKEKTCRTAVATGSIRVGPQVMEAVLARSAPKGDVLGVARVAGIMAVKRTWELIPMCHPLPVGKCSIDFQSKVGQGLITAVCTVKTEGQTGVEMEALTGVAVALLTVYDMCKAVDKGMSIEDVRLVSKRGGKSGDFNYGE